MKKSLIAFAAIIAVFILILILTHPPKESGKADASELTCSECGRTLEEGDTYLKYWDSGTDASVQLCVGCIYESIRYVEKPDIDHGYFYKCDICGMEYGKLYKDYTVYNDELTICDKCLYEHREW